MSPPELLLIRLQRSGRRVWSFVEPFGNGGGAALREAAVKLLGERKEIELVSAAAGADRLLDGQRLRRSKILRDW
jgi:hypothetical protein